MTEVQSAQGRAGSVASALERHPTRALFILLALGFLVRLPFAILVPPSSDLRTIVEWAHGIAQNGLVATTNTAHWPYPPLSMILAGAAGVVSSGLVGALGSGDALVVFLIKLPAILADVGLAWLVVTMLQGRPIQFRLGVAAMILFNPALWYLSAVWGQTDAI